MSSNNNPQTPSDTPLGYTANERYDTGMRNAIASSLGQTGFNATGKDNNRRNLYEVYGWPRDDLDGWDEENWLALYLRNAYAAVVNDKPAFTSWRDNPIIKDTDRGADSEFETEIEKLARNKKLWSYAERVDRAAGIHQHGLLLIGLSDTKNNLDAWRTDAREQSFSSLDDITTYKPILGSQIDDINWGNVTDGERWDKPLEYTIDLSEDVDEETEDDPISNITVHHSRVVDVPATRPLEGEILARPRAEPVLNNLLDIEKTLGAAAEAAYRGADYGLHINADPSEVDLSDGADELKEELQRYENNLQRYIRTQGVDINRLGGGIEDPTGIIESNLDAISAATGIPKKELRGNETGEVAGAEADERSWFGVMEERRGKYCTPYIVRPILDQHREIGVLSDPSTGMYEVNWKDLRTLNETERAELEAQRSNVVNAVATLSGERALRYVAEGTEAFEDQVELDPEELPDEQDSDVQAEFSRVTDNETVVLDALGDD